MVKGEVKWKLGASSVSRLGLLPFGLSKGANATLQPAPHAPWLKGSVWRASNEHGILQQRRKTNREQRTYRLGTVGVGGICRGVSVSVKKKASGWVWEEMAAFLEEAAGIKSPWEERRVWRTYPL
jgi:hypothetical protein